MFWKRHKLDLYLAVGRTKRLQWFWRYIVRKKPMCLSVMLMARSNFTNETLFVDAFTLAELNIDQASGRQYVEDDIDG